MAVMTVKVVEVEVPCDERCVWCEEARAIAHTVDGFCEFCGAPSHPCA